MKLILNYVIKEKYTVTYYKIRQDQMHIKQTIFSLIMLKSIKTYKKIQ